MLPLHRLADRTRAVGERNVCLHLLGESCTGWRDGRRYSTNGSYAYGVRSEGKPCIPPRVANGGRPCEARASASLHGLATPAIELDV